MEIFETMSNENPPDKIPNPLFSDIKIDSRPQRGLWAPGNYLRVCDACNKPFTGDKRAGMCADCAYADNSDRDCHPRPDDVRETIRKGMIQPLEDYNKRKMEEHKKKRAQGNGIACPKCGAEMRDRDSHTLMSQPPKKAVICLECGHNDFAIV